MSAESWLFLDGKQYRMVGDVRIYPPRIVFYDPFEGKRYEHRLFIQNAGRKSVFLRILEPTSSGIKVKCLKSGKTLPPGLTLQRMIRYTVTMATLVQECILPIMIDDYRLMYEIHIQIAMSRLEVQPQFLDFGVIDAGPTISKRTVKIFNRGRKPEHFSLDLANNYLNITVSPLSGVIMRNSHVELNIEVNFCVVGTYETEFWVICRHPICVKVFVEVILAKLEAIHPHALKTFTYIQFKRTYYGCRSVSSMLVKNVSQESSLFCVSGEYQGNVVSLYKKDNEVDDFKHFAISPLSGRLRENDVWPFIMTFEPKDDLAVKGDAKKDYFLVVMVINKIYCKDVEKTATIDTRKHASFGCSSIDQSSAMLITSEDGGYTLSATFFEGIEVEVPIVSPETFFTDNIRIILYGDAERASVSVVPDELILRDLLVGETCARTLLLTNNSASLPIVYRSVKLVFVEVVPKSGRLEPLESREIAVHVTPHSFMNVNAMLRLDLLHSDDPKMDDALRVVGKVEVRIFLHEKVVGKPRRPDGVPAIDFDYKKPNTRPKKEVLKVLQGDGGLLALPDDRACSVRPWRSDKVTIYAAIPRISNVLDEYQLAFEADRLKQSNRAYYSKYLKCLALQVMRKQEANNKFMGYDIHEFSRCMEAVSKPVVPRFQANFIPLTSLELFNIIITPRNIFMDYVVSKSCVKNKVTIRNNNTMSIRVHLKPKKMALFLFTRDRLEVGPMDEQEISYMYYAEMVGTRTDMLDVVINDNHVFETSVTVKVHSSTFEFSTSEIKFKRDAPTWTTLQVHNPMNVGIHFEWDMVGDMLVTPEASIVGAGKTLSCIVAYEIGKCTCLSYDLMIRMGSYLTKTIRVVLDNILYPVEFVDKIRFGDVGVNVEKKVVSELINNSYETLGFVFELTSFGKGVVITPMEGTVVKRGRLPITVAVNLSTPGEFSCSARVRVARYQIYKFVITGHVRNPKVAFCPELIRFRKISASSFDSNSFSFGNVGIVPAVVSFAIGALSDLSLSENGVNTSITLEDEFRLLPGQWKKLTVCYSPTYPMATSYHLPVVINKLTDTHSLRLRVSSSPYKLQLNHWSFSFESNAFDSHQSKTSERVLIINPNKCAVKFCIRLDELGDAFRLCHLTGGEVTYHECSLVCVLCGEEFSRFQLDFTPLTPGSYAIQLPVYIKDDASETMHNAIRLKGVYYGPQITFDCEEVYFGYLPVNFSVGKVVRVILKIHKVGCRLQVFTPDTNLKVYKEECAVDSETSLTMEYGSADTHVLNALVKVTCSCGGAARLKCLGGVEAAFPTNHVCVSYFQRMQELPSVPSFETHFKMNQVHSPTGASSSMINLNAMEKRKRQEYPTPLPYYPTSEYAIFDYMEETVAALEQWIYEQVFYREVCYRIPDTVCLYSLKMEEQYSSSKRRGVRRRLCMLPLCRILERLAGSKINEMFDCYYEENVKIPLFVYNLYVKVLAFLVEVESIFPHVQPYYLLSYVDYLEYFELIGRKDAKPLSEFYLLSKQCWLDVLLQTYKVLVYKRMFSYPRAAKSDTDKRSLFCNTHSIDAISTYLINNHIVPCVYSCEDSMLLNWLQSMLFLLKHNVDPANFGLDNYNSIQNKKVCTFDVDLNDGIALLAATIYYCPFLMKYLEGFYIIPETKEEHIHNACLLLNAWSMVNPSFTLVPKDIYDPHPMKMAMFLAYMYEFLAHLKATETMEFTTSLNTKSRTRVGIRNDNDCAIKFTIRFFGNDDGTFSSPVSTITVPSKANGKVSVVYNAKFARVQHATLVLNGENSLGRFTNSKSFNLVGLPVLVEPAQTVVLASTVYVSKQVSMQLQSPIAEVTEYEAFITYEEPSSVNTLKLVPVSSLIDNTVLARMIVLKHTATSDARGKLSFEGVVCAITKNPFIVWAFLRSPLVDFYVQIKFVATHSKECIALDLMVPCDFEKICVCTCKKGPDIMNSGCPCIVVLHVPSRNEKLWQTIINIYLGLTSMEDQEFWITLHSTAAGLRIIRRILEDRKKFVSPDMSYIFRENIIYNVSTTNAAAVSAHKVKMTSAPKTQLKIHLGPEVKSFKLLLESDDDRELRRYFVKVKHTENLFP